MFCVEVSTDTLISDLEIEVDIIQFQITWYLAYK